MATTKKSTIEEEKIVEAKPAPDCMRTIIVPRLNDKNAEQSIYICVNNKDYLIKRGCQVEVPDSVVEVLRNQEAMLEYAEAYDKSLANNRKSKE